MNLTPREKMIALVTLGLVVVIVGYFYMLAPYLAARAQAIDDIQKAQTEYDKDQQLIKNQPKVAADWKALLAANLKTAPAPAISGSSDALFDAARNSRFELQAVKPDRPKQEGDFQSIRLQASGSGTTASVYRFLATIEKSDLPMKIEEFRVNSRKDGTDDLNITLTVTALIFSPPVSTRPAAAQSTGGSI